MPKAAGRWLAKSPIDSYIRSNTEGAWQFAGTFLFAFVLGFWWVSPGFILFLILLTAVPW
jgi:hypothetical protein